MQTLRKTLEEGEANGVAIGHFNISDLVILKGVFEAARDRKVPVIVGASEGERAFVGDRQLFALVESLRDELNTEVRLAWRHGLDSALSEKPDEIVPYKILPSVVESVRQVVTSRLALFGSGGRSARVATQ